MTQEYKELLLKDLCARLPYGVICTDNCHGDSRVFNVDIEDKSVYYTDFDEYGLIENCKPYLRPMSSMTEEETKQRNELGILVWSNSNGEIGFDGFGNISAEGILKALDWLNAHHFDYRGLIPIGLALQAPKDMYK